MIGRRKLSTIRKQIEKALASTGADPIQRLERQIASAKRKGDRTEVLEGLKRFLESARSGTSVSAVRGKSLNEAAPEKGSAAFWCASKSSGVRSSLPQATAHLPVCLKQPLQWRKNRCPGGRTHDHNRSSRL
jgi:hypothetical protein